MSKASLNWQRLSESAAFWGGVVFAFALALRIAGLGWGLPNELRQYSLHPDEPIVYAYSQRINVAKGEFDPQFYQYPTLYLTTLSIATKVVEAYAAPAGPVPGKELVHGQETARNRERLAHLAGRWISALSGAGICWAIVALLWPRTHRLGAVMGGLAAAVAPGLVVHSRFQTVDMLATFLLTMCLVYAAKLIPNRGDESQSDPKVTLRYALLTGLFAGLSAGTKYTGTLALSSFAVALFFLPSAHRLKAGLTGVFAACLAFVVSTPGCIVNSSKFIEDLRYEMVHTSTGHGLVFEATPSGFAYHIGNLISGLGPILLLLGVGGLFFAAWRRHGWALAMFVFLFLSYLLIGRAEVKFMRYVFPMIPVIALGFGWLMGQAQLNPVRRLRLLVGLGIIGLGGFGGGGLATNMLYTAFMRQPDVRDQAARYIQQQPGEKRVAVTSDPWFYSISIHPLFSSPRPVWVQLDKQSPGFISMTLPGIRFVLPSTPWSETILDSKPDYVAFSSFEADDLDRIGRRVSGGPGADEARAYANFITRLKVGYELDNLYGLDGPTIHDMMYIRPRIWIWKRKTDSTSSLKTSSTASSSSAEPASIR